MDMEQQKEWGEAQKIALSVNLVEAAKKQLIFLAAVDRNRYLYEDHALQRAIYRYNAFWLPLLAKHLENPVSEDPLVVPLDCEWIWHCHRLNPIRYKLDCEKLYGRILGNCNVISSVQSTSKIQTKEIWNLMYPEEPYELDINLSFPEDALQKGRQNEKFTSYDLVSAVKRQIAFTFQVSRPHMSNDLFLQEAEARYKGFLHLIRTNRKMGINRFCVPTYDVDLMWHTHQLNPYYYCKDLIKILGKVLEHDDTDSDRTKGSKLDTGFSETSRQWEETFGKRYWKAGAMNRGSTPTPVTHVPCEFKYEPKEIRPMENFDKPIQLSARKVVEVFLEFVEIKNLPHCYKDNLLVSFSKKQSDMLFNIKRSLSVFSLSGEKQLAYFQCEPTGEFLFELMSQSPSGKSKLLGSCSLSLQELQASSQLSADKWLSVNPISNLKISEPILLHVSVSCTPPTPAPQEFHLEQPQHLLPFFKSSCFLPGKVKPASTRTYVMDNDGKTLFSLQMRTMDKDAAKCTPELLNEVLYTSDSGDKHQVAEFMGENWVIKGRHGLFMLKKNYGKDGHLFELVGNKMVKLFPGRRLDFESRNCGNRCEEDFITVVEFSADHPYGRAVALFDLKFRTIKAQDEWMVLPGIILGFILPDILSREGYGGFTAQSGDQVALDSGITDGGMQADMAMEECNSTKVNCSDVDCEAHNESGSCGGGNCGSGKCGGGMVKSSLYGGACGYADKVNNSSSACSGGCGGGCGGEDTLKVKNRSSACGSGCGGGCGGGVMLKAENGSSACGSGCGGGCGGCGGGVMSNVKNGSSACGSGCGGGCGGGVMPKVTTSIMNEPTSA